jgi:lipoate---protein ligase
LIGPPGSSSTGGEQMGSWLVERYLGPAEYLFHELPEEQGRVIRVLRADQPTIVLGSRQRVSPVVRDLGVPVVRRRSGGTAVWLDDTLLWLDVTLPAGDPLWRDDVNEAGLWLGDAIAEHLGGNAMTYRGPMIRNTWSELICFAGLGSGEVTRQGRKVVGVCQRRTKNYARFQVAILRSWEPSPLLTALGIDDEPGRQFVESAALGEPDLDEVSVISAIARC